MTVTYYHFRIKWEVLKYILASIRDSEYSVGADRDRLHEVYSLFPRRFRGAEGVSVVTLSALPGGGRNNPCLFRLGKGRVCFTGTGTSSFRVSSNNVGTLTAKSLQSLLISSRDGVSRTKRSEHTLFCCRNLRIDLIFLSFKPLGLLGSSFFVA